MEEIVSREQLIDYFIESCDLLQNYLCIKQVLYEELEKEESNVEELLTDYRGLHQKFDYLVPVLILTARYYFEHEGVYSLAAIYLANVIVRLEYLDENHLLKGYVLGELGYVYECMGELQQANHYYTTALSFSREKQIPLLAIYSLDHLVHMMLIYVSEKVF